MSESPSGNRQPPRGDYDAVIVGAGFAGLYMLHRLRGLGLTARVFETGGGVGGTWYWNRYPGARCDIESMEYSYQFSEELQQEWVWSEKYATQPEILRYLNHVADRFDLRRDIQFHTRVESAVFDEARRLWVLRTTRGDEATAQFCLMATGPLSSPNTPRFKGIERFRGEQYHTGHWPEEEVDFTGKRVGVIGTGSSGIQSIPLIARQAARLFVFQRTPAYTIPARNAPLDPAEVSRIKADYARFRAESKQSISGFKTHPRRDLALAVGPEERRKEYEERWARGGLPFLSAFADIMFSKEANDTAAEFVRGKIRELVKDPAVAEKLMPRTILGCKRLCVDTDYYATFNRPNVTLVDVSETPIEEITETGVNAAGASYELDALVFATGFDAITGTLLKIDIRGRDGLSLGEAWAAGPRSYLGLGIAGFPNLFTIAGPGSPSILANMVPSIEQHVEWIAGCIARLRERNAATIEATEEAQDSWVREVHSVIGTTLFTQCDSWFLGANIPGKPRVFSAYFGFPRYVERCNRVAERDYEGFLVA
jgi:cation diffusion facilitator CzcD-associated flavoprotein CzcO